MPEKVLTVIIPFLNEKYEVEHTLESIKAHSTDRVEVMVINDASDDDFDYQALAEKYDIIYIENTERLGVAASRDIGIDRCRTPWFLLLDAHMRFYDHAWEDRIIDELEKDGRALLCCQTKVLMLENGLLIAPNDRRTAYGAYVEINESKALVEPDWVFGLPFDGGEAQTLPIACVLGATYACSKVYWQYLRGLEGLKYYGSDEPYISMKVWMEGGSCKLLKDVVIGHIYRTNSTPPYDTKMKYRIYNKLWIAELFFPESLRKELFAKAGFYFPRLFPEVMYMLYDNREAMKQARAYYEKIFTRDFDFFRKLNDSYHRKQLFRDQLVEPADRILDEIADRLTAEPVADTGLLKGRMGMILFLFHYGRFSDREEYKRKAEQMLAELLADLKPDMHYGLCTGLSGIGWGIVYLFLEGFVEGDLEEIVEEVDRKMMEADPGRIVNINQDYGLSGIVTYLLARLYVAKQENRKGPFDEEYLDRVSDRIEEIIAQRDTSCDKLEVLLDFMYYRQAGEEISRPHILDVCDMLNPQNIPLRYLGPGLRGAAGIGLRLIFDKVENK